jgi:hypothetical protein
VTTVRHASSRASVGATTAHTGSGRPSGAQPPGYGSSGEDGGVSAVDAGQIAFGSLPHRIYGPST